VTAVASRGPLISFGQSLEAMMRLDWSQRVCQGPDAWIWTSDEEYDRKAAQARCMECPLRAACLAIAEMDRPSAGVWGGVDFQVVSPGDRAGDVPPVKRTRQLSEPPLTSRGRPAPLCRECGLLRVWKARRCSPCWRRAHGRTVVPRGRVTVDVVTDAVSVGRTREDVARMLGVQRASLERSLHRAPGGKELLAQLPTERSVAK
jgi:Transcription factor WhiB